MRATVYCGEITVTFCVVLFVTETNAQLTRCAGVPSMSMRSGPLPASCGYVVSRSPTPIAAVSASTLQ